MLDSTLLFNAEFYVFIIIEALMISGYFIFARYSRNHGGAFDRRIDDRRGHVRVNGPHAFDRRMYDIGFGQVKVEIAGNNEAYDVDTNRRLSDRRVVQDRRKNIFIYNN
jgi:hypothetical protein